MMVEPKTQPMSGSVKLGQSEGVAVGSEEALVLVGSVVVSSDVGSTVGSDDVGSTIGSDDVGSTVGSDEVGSIVGSEVGNRTVVVSNVVAVVVVPFKVTCTRISIEGSLWSIMQALTVAVTIAVAVAGPVTVLVMVPAGISVPKRHAQLLLKRVSLAYCEMKYGTATAWRRRRASAVTVLLKMSVKLDPGLW